MKPRTRSWVGFAAALTVSFVGLLVPAPLPAQEFDVLLENGTVVDGSGNPGFRADVGIRGDRIAAVGDLDGRSAERTIDASGLTIAPGFIDLHTHVDRSLVADSVEPRRAHNLIAQGITTSIGGPDGRNAVWPVSKEMATLRDPGIAMNFVPMVGHSTVRSEVMGDDYEREATPAEIERMKELVRQGMEDGAWGLGAGPEYRPARFSATPEIVELAEVVADYDGFYVSHQRSQSPLPLWQVPSMVDEMPLSGTDGMKETIEIGRQTGIRVVGTHIKTKGMDTWGHSAEDIIRIERAREEGVEVYLDQYPYNTFGGGAHTVLPPWAFAEPGTDYSGGMDDPKWRRDGIFANFRENLRANVKDPDFGPTLRRDVRYLIRLKGGAERLIIVDTPLGSDLVGQTLAEVAEDRNLTPVEMLVEFALEGGTRENPHGVLFRPLAGHEYDVKKYMKQEYTATSTDGGVSLGEVEPGQHPRYFGAMVRKIAHWVKEEGTISLPFAIRSNTSLPAQIIGLPDRGLVRAGYAADILVFNYEQLDDRATILQPGRYPEGIEYMLVNGEFAIDEGELTGNLAGRVLDRNDYEDQGGGVATEGESSEEY